MASTYDADSGWSERWIEYLSGDGKTGLIAESMADSIVSHFTILAGGVLFGSLVYHHIKEFIDNKELKPDLWYIFRNFSMYFIFINYTFVIGALGGTLDSLNSGIYSVMNVKSDSFAETYLLDKITADRERLGISEADLKKIKKEWNPGMDNLDENMDLISENSNDDFDPFWSGDTEELEYGTTQVMYFISFLFIAFIRMITFGLTTMFGYILFILGPLAFISSMIPIWRNKAKQWFGTYLVVKLTILTLVFIEYLRDFVISSSTVDVVTSSDIQTYAHLSFAFGSVAMFLSAYYITSRWIGSSDAGEMMTLGVFYSTKLAGDVVDSVKGVSDAVNKGKGSDGGTDNSGNSSIATIGNIFKKGLKDNDPGFKKKS